MVFEKIQDFLAGYLRKALKSYLFMLANGQKKARRNFS